MRIDKHILNIHGFVHGGALFSLADTAAGAASFTSGRDSVTLSGTINYIKPEKVENLSELHRRFLLEEQQVYMRYLSLMMKMCYCLGQPLRCFFRWKSLVTIHRQVEIK